MTIYFLKKDNYDVISNTPVTIAETENAEKILIRLQNELKQYIDNGFGPFLAAIYDENGNFIEKAVNSVVSDCCSNKHAEINVISKVQKKLSVYDLSPYNLSIYVTSEPCIMCLGAIMWSGIKKVYYGVPSKKVEEITGFDEGFKPNWFDEFSERGISVYGNIAPNAGEKILFDYVNSGKKVYKPVR